MYLHRIYKPHPLDQLDEQKIVLAVIKHFSEHYPESFSIPEMSKDIGISLTLIETAFDDYKGKSANQALLEYRLNRLCDHMANDPSQEIHIQIHDCGLVSFAKTNIDFIEQFGIDLVEFHEQCFIAAAARIQYERNTKGTKEDDLVGSPSTSDYEKTRFNRKTDMTIKIEWQDQFGSWHHFQNKQNQADAYRVAKHRTESTGKRHRLVDGEGCLLDLLAP